MHEGGRSGGLGSGSLHVYVGGGSEPCACACMCVGGHPVLFGGLFVGSGHYELLLLSM